MKGAFDSYPEPTLARIDFALLLARCDRVEQAYGLLCQLPMEDLLSVQCPPRLDQLANVFRQMADEGRAQACEAHARQVRAQWRSQS